MEFNVGEVTISKKKLSATIYCIIYDIHFAKNSNVQMLHFERSSKRLLKAKGKNKTGAKALLYCVQFKAIPIQWIIGEKPYCVALEKLLKFK